MAKKINIGDTDGNADWIKSLPGHKDEIAIHDALAKKLKKKGKEDLEESIALALQNYRDGVIDADDLVAFLVPTRLEEAKENDDETGQGT